MLHRNIIVKKFVQCTIFEGAGEPQARPTASAMATANA